MESRLNKFQDKVVVVTGGASGIGFETARLFAEAGAIVAINDVRGEAAEKAAGILARTGGRATAFPGDISSIESVRKNAREIVARFGRVDVLVNNAGLSTFAPAEELAIETWRKAIAVNLDGAFFWAQTVAVASMIPNRAGVIVNVASGAGLAAIPNNVAYVASKHGVVGLTKALAVEWGRYGIRVNCLCPGVTETDMIRSDAAKHPALFAERRKRVPLGRSAQPIEQAEAILFLSAPEASYVHGLIMNVDGGQQALFSGFSSNAQ